MISSSSLAVIKTIYRTDEPQEVVTRLGTQTVILFNTEIEFASVGNSNFFDIEKDQKLDKLIVTPLSFGVWTNLIVITKDNLRYVFKLVEDDSRDYYDIVEVKPSADINYRDIINLVNKKKVSIDPAIKQLIKIYDVDENSYSLAYPSYIILSLKRAVLIENLGKTVFWFRVFNSTNSDESIGIPLNSVEIKERELFAVAAEDNKEKLNPGEFCDYYIIVEGVYLDSSYTFKMNINGNKKEFLVENIPYLRQDFNVFVADEEEYKNVIIDDYRR